MDLPTPAPLGPAWEPLDTRDWAPFRDIIMRSGRVGERRGVQRAEPLAAQHGSLEGLEAFTQPAFFRPEPGQVFLVVPFAIPGPNHLDGTVILFWNGSSYVRACHEYCRELGAPRSRELRLRTADPRELRFVTCREGSATCASWLVHAYSSFVRHFSPSLISGVTFGEPAAP